MDLYPQFFFGTDSIVKKMFPPLRLVVEKMTARWQRGRFGDWRWDLPWVAVVAMAIFGGHSWGDLTDVRYQRLRFAVVPIVRTWPTNKVILVNFYSHNSTPTLQWTIVIEKWGYSYLRYKPITIRRLINLIRKLQRFSFPQTMARVWTPGPWATWEVSIHFGKRRIIPAPPFARPLELLDWLILGAKGIQDQLGWDIQALHWRTDHQLPVPLVAGKRLSDAKLFHGIDSKEEVLHAWASFWDPQISPEPAVLEGWNDSWFKIDPFNVWGVKVWMVLGRLGFLLHQPFSRRSFCGRIGFVQTLPDWWFRLHPVFFLCFDKITCLASL